MKVVLVGLTASGKTVLSRQLSLALDLPVFRGDDFRRLLGDGTVAGDYRARSAFIQSCATAERGIFEFSGVGAHRVAVRHALLEHGGPVRVVTVWCDEEVRRQRLSARVLTVPRPDWGLSPTHDAGRQIERLRRDHANGFWAPDAARSHIEVRGDSDVTIAVRAIRAEVAAPASPPPPPDAANRPQIADALGVAPSSLEPWDDRPIAQRERPAADEMWRAVAPEVEESALERLTVSLESTGWTTVIAPAGPTRVTVAAIHPDRIGRLAVSLRIRARTEADAWFARFVERFERASASRAASDAVGWFTIASEAVEALLRGWWVARGFGDLDYESEIPPVRHKLPMPLRRELRWIGPSLDLATSLGEAKRIHEFAVSLASDLNDASINPSALPTLLRWLPLLRDVCEARDALWNFRDVAKHAAGYLRTGRLFRGSSPTRYAPGPDTEGIDAFETWRRAHGISVVLDLRNDEEVERSPYPTPWEETMTRFHIPITGGVPEGLGEHLRPDQTAYLGFMEGNRDGMREAILRIAESKGPVLVHCHAGMDRTGVVIALVCYLIKVPREAIVADYLSSGGTTTGDRIEAFIDHLRSIGPPDAVATQLELPTATLAALRERLLTETP
ncbi:MAG: tyrosine-protein phosphatase [Planctomycetota bacterium]|nr:tyrosine-protein phosphatase [Planctomycetota bacterium]